MFFKPVFFYNTDAPEVEGGGVDTQQQQQNNPDTSAVQKVELPAEVLAKLQEYEELKAWKAEKEAPSKSEEQLAKEKEAGRAEFLKYSVDNDLLKIDEFTKYETLSSKQDADLVWENFLNEFKEDNPELTDENELSEIAKEQFNNIYKLNSDNEKIKERGLAKLSKEAEQIRNPYKSKIETAQASFNQHKGIQNKMPQFDKFVDEQISKFAPEKISFKLKSGEEEIPVEIELTKEDKEAIAKEFKTHKTFYNYNQSKEATEKSLEKKITGWIKVNKFEQALENAAKTFEGIGLAKGSNVGAENLFSLQQAKPVKDSGISNNQAANQAAAKARAALR